MLDEQQVRNAVDEELLNPQFLNRKHGTDKTYTAGCRGPLCKKAERDRGLRRLEKTRGDRVVRVRSRPARMWDELLAQLTETHWRSRGLDQDDTSTSR